MELGFVLPQVGPMAGPEALVTVAQRAEAQGFSSLWVTDRLLWPVSPKAPYAATPDGSLPEAYKRVIDPLSALTFVAAHTKTATLGTSVLDIPFYNPVVLARQLTAVDVLSNGRLRVGFGIGWSPDEMQAAGAEMRQRGKRADEFIAVLKTIWTTDPAEFQGDFYRLPQSVISLKPVQKPHPPIYLAAYAPASMSRVARLADGWNPAGIPLEGMEQMMGGIRGMAAEAGRDPASLALIVRANCYVTPEPISENRFIFTGTPEQIAGDVRACEGIGANEVFFDVQFSTGVTTTADVLAHMEALRAAVK